MAFSLIEFYSQCHFKARKTSGVMDNRVRLCPEPTNLLNPFNANSNCSIPVMLGSSDPIETCVYLAADR